MATKRNVYVLIENEAEIMQALPDEMLFERRTVYAVFSDEDEAHDKAAIMQAEWDRAEAGDMPLTISYTVEEVPYHDDTE